MLTMKSKTSPFKPWSIFFAFAAFVMLAGCDEDPPLPDNLVQFESGELGFASDEQTLTVNIPFSREASTDTEISLTAELVGVSYETEFTTSPAMDGNSLVIPVPKGATQVSFDINKEEDVLLDGDETIAFTLATVGNDLVPGERSALVVSFSEILADEGTMDPNVGGQEQPNKVFIDLSANRQTSVHRSDWDLGFYMAAGEFRVILNSASSMMARALDKNDLNAVTAEDTTGWGQQLSTDAVFAAITSGPPPAWVSEATSWIDDPAGDLSATAIAEIAAAASDNNVFIVNRGAHPDGTPRGWKKVRIIRNGDNYTLQHADIDATSFTSIDITRDEEFLFNYVKFETGVVEIEPKKEKWDIAFTVFTNTTAFGPGLTVPYVFNDVVIQNRFDTETAELLTATAGTYEDFDEADLAGVTFGTSQINIGSSWRSGGGPGSGPALKEDRFYVIKDSAGNIYKLKFTALTQNGERGRPQFQFALVSQGV